jgi:hypothetical protein
MMIAQVPSPSGSVISLGTLHSYCHVVAVDNIPTDVAFSSVKPLAQLQVDSSICVGSTLL